MQPVPVAIINIELLPAQLLDSVLGSREQIHRINELVRPNNLLVRTSCQHMHTPTGVGLLDRSERYGIDQHVPDQILLLVEQDFL